MNVLMFTMTMLMMLAAMTYARLDHFRTFQISEIAFESYMNDGEFKFLDKEADKWYAVVVNPKSQNDSERTLKSGTTKLSWSLFFEKEEREKNEANFKEITDLSRKLILSLFKNSQNLQKMIENSPDIMDRFFISLINAGDRLSPKMKIKDAPQISNLDLNDEELNLFRYELFKENIDATNPDKTYSLLDYLTVAPLKLRVYLASTTLLKAIFNQDENIVNKIVEERKRLYREVKNKNMKNEEASLEFNDYMKTLCPYLSDNLFDCSVTKTDPKKYE